MPFGTHHYTTIMRKVAVGAETTVQPQSARILDKTEEGKRKQNSEDFGRLPENIRSQMAAMVEQQRTGASRPPHTTQAVGQGAKNPPPQKQMATRHSAPAVPPTANVTFKSKRVAGVSAAVVAPPPPVAVGNKNLVGTHRSAPTHHIQQTSRAREAQLRTTGTTQVEYKEAPLVVTGELVDDVVKPPTSSTETNKRKFSSVQEKKNNKEDRVATEVAGIKQEKKDLENPGKKHAAQRNPQAVPQVEKKKQHDVAPLDPDMIGAWEYLTQIIPTWEPQQQTTSIIDCQPTSMSPAQLVAQKHERETLPVHRERQEASPAAPPKRVAAPQQVQHVAKPLSPLHQKPSFANDTPLLISHPMQSEPDDVPCCCGEDDNLFNMSALGHPTGAAEKTSTTQEQRGVGGGGDVSDTLPLETEQDVVTQTPQDEQYPLDGSATHDAPLGVGDAQDHDQEGNDGSSVVSMSQVSSKSVVSSGSSSSSSCSDEEEEEPDEESPFVPPSRSPAPARHVSPASENVASTASVVTATVAAPDETRTEVAAERASKSSHREESDVINGAVAPPASQASASSAEELLDGVNNEDVANRIVLSSTTAQANATTQRLREAVIDEDKIAQANDVQRIPRPPQQVVGTVDNSSRSVVPNKTAVSTIDSKDENESEDVDVHDDDDDNDNEGCVNVSCPPLMMTTSSAGKSHPAAADFVDVDAEDDDDNGDAIDGVDGNEAIGAILHPNLQIGTWSERGTCRSSELFYPHVSIVYTQSVVPVCFVDDKKKERDNAKLRHQEQADAEGEVAALSLENDVPPTIYQGATFSLHLSAMIDQGRDATVEALQIVTRDGDDVTELVCGSTHGGSVSSQTLHNQNDGIHHQTVNDLGSFAIHKFVVTFGCFPMDDAHGEVRFKIILQAPPLVAENELKEAIPAQSCEITSKVVLIKKMARRSGDGMSAKKHASSTSVACAACAKPSRLQQLLLQNTLSTKFWTTDLLTPQDKLAGCAGHSSSPMTGSYDGQSEDGGGGGWFCDCGQSNALLDDLQQQHPTNPTMQTRKKGKGRSAKNGSNNKIEPDQPQRELLMVCPAHDHRLSALISNAKVMSNSVVDARAKSTMLMYMVATAMTGRANNIAARAVAGVHGRSNSRGDPNQRSSKPSLRSSIPTEKRKREDVTADNALKFKKAEEEHVVVHVVKKGEDEDCGPCPSARSVKVEEGTTTASSSSSLEQVIDLAATNRNVVFLGDITDGVCRHRALLFKILADACGVECYLVRGHHVDGVAEYDHIHDDDDVDLMGERHTWNLVTINSTLHIVDTMLSPESGPFPWPDPHYRQCKAAPRSHPNIVSLEGLMADATCWHLVPTGSRGSLLGAGVEAPYVLGAVQGRGANSVVHAASMNGLAMAVKVPAQPKDALVLRYEYDVLVDLHREEETGDGRNRLHESARCKTTTPVVKQEQEDPAQEVRVKVEECDDDYHQPPAPQNVVKKTNVNVESGACDDLLTPSIIHATLGWMPLVCPLGFHRGSFVMEIINDSLLGVMNMLTLHNKVFSLPQIRSVVKAVSLALSLVHAKGYIHTDVKAENVLLVVKRCKTCVSFGGVCCDKCELEAKLADFADAVRVKEVHQRDGMTTVTMSPSAREEMFTPGELSFGLSSHPNSAPSTTVVPVVDDPSSSVGTAAYNAPEVQLHSPYSYASDLWSLGVLACEMYNMKLTERRKSVSYCCPFVRRDACRAYCAQQQQLEEQIANSNTNESDEGDVLPRKRAKKTDNANRDSSTAIEIQKVMKQTWKKDNKKSCRVPILVGSHSPKRVAPQWLHRVVDGCLVPEWTHRLTALDVFHATQQ